MFHNKDEKQQKENYYLEGFNDRKNAPYLRLNCDILVSHLPDRWQHFRTF